MLNSMLTCKIHFVSTIPDLKSEAGLEKKSNRKNVESVSLIHMGAAGVEKMVGSML